MTKKLWSLFSILLIAAMVLTACAPSNTGNNAGEEPMEEAAGNNNNNAAAEEPMEEEPMEEMEPVTISIWHSLKDVEIEALSAVTEAFQAEHPNVTFDVLFVPDEDLRNKYETAAATGEGPDMLIGSDDWGPSMYDALLVADVSDLGDDAFFSSINQGVLAEGSYKGAQVGVPYNLKGVILYRNTLIQPEPAADFADLFAKAEAATTDDVFGALLEVGDFFSFGHLYGLGGSLMTPEGDPAFNSAEGVAYLEMLQQFYALGADSWHTDNDVNLFKEGKVGWIIDGTWNIDPIVTALGEENVAIDPWPADMSGFVQAKYLFLNANTTGAVMDETKLFMAFMLSPEAQGIIAGIDPGFLPVTEGVDFTGTQRLQAVAAMSTGVPFPVIPEMGAFWGPMGTAIQSVLVDGADPAEALQTAFDAVTAAVAEIRAGQ